MFGQAQKIARDQARGFPECLPFDWELRGVDAAVFDFQALHLVCVPGPAPRPVPNLGRPFDLSAMTSITGIHPGKP